VIFAAVALCASAADVRLGIIGTDTSHAVEFTRILNDETAPDHVPGARVAAAYKGGSADIQSSISRVDQYAEEIRSKYGIEIVSDIQTLLGKVDGVLLESLDGRPHLTQARPVIAAQKALFIDKPMAATLEDAREIARLAKDAGVAWFSSSSLRFSDVVAGLKFSDAVGAITWGPGPFEPHHALDLAWYAIHPIEMLYTLMGTGCESVTRIVGQDADVVVGRWKDGRIGMVRANRPGNDYGGAVFRQSGTVVSRPQGAGSYRPLVVEIVKFFQTGQPPVPNEETLEIFAFLDAAQRSKAQGGIPVALR
jgi:hypothetical protein